MAKKPSAVYEPGELDRVRKNLGKLNPEEAKKIAQTLGGEVGVEKVFVEPERERHRNPRSETMDVSVGNRGASKTTPIRRVELAPDGAGPDKAQLKQVKSTGLDPADDPSVPVKANYRERLKMDRYAAQAEFEIKNPTQVIYSMLALFGDPPDFINPDFVSRRMNEYYTRIETLVTATRSLLPRNQVQRNEKFKKANPFAYSVIDVIRYWNIERIASELARMQSRPRNVRLVDFIDILKAVYRPIYLLERLDLDSHIREAYRSLYKMIILEEAQETAEKYQGLLRSSLAAYAIISKNIRFLMYPLLLKTLSDRWLAYEDLFVHRKKRILAFLNVSESERILPPILIVPQDLAPLGENQIKKEEAQLKEEEGPQKQEQAAANHNKELDPSTGLKDAPNRGLQRGLETLEALFPAAGWQRLTSFPDLYPYFTGLFDLKKGYELIAPRDPLHQVSILMHIMEELCYGLRYVAFGTIQGPDGNAERVDDGVNMIISHWRDYIEQGFSKEYLPRLAEYCRVIESSPESRTTGYAKRLLNELSWLKRLYFLPYFRFESIAPPPFRKQDIEPFYTEVRQLRRLLTAVAAGIEKGIKTGGQEKKSPCDGIDNPWDPYIFQVPNPLSLRLDVLLGGKNSKKKTNAALVFFSLSVVTVLDHLINHEQSWAYDNNSYSIFRSVGGEGIKPVFGVDETVDADALFKQAIKKKGSPT